MSECKIRFIDYNYPFQSNVEVTATSQSADFPASNLKKYFRSKVWRSSGSFVIDATNNKINFVEVSLGPELTATLTPGTYSVAALAAEIKTQLEAASANARTYTVSQSGVTGKWTIAGQVYLDLLFSTGTNSAISPRNVLGFGASDFTGAITYTGPLTAIHTLERVVFDLETAEDIDTIALIFDPKVGHKLTDLAVVKVEANPSNNWTAPLYSQTLTIDDTHETYTLFLTTAQSYRYWSINIVDPQNPNLYVELGTVILGKGTALNRCADVGFEYRVTDASKIEDNEYGNEYVDIYPQRKELSFNMNVLTYDQKKELEASFIRVGSRVPVFVCIDPLEAAFDKDEMSIYGRMSKDLSLRHLTRSYFGTSIKISETF